MRKEKDLAELKNKEPIAYQNKRPLLRYAAINDFEKWRGLFLARFLGSPVSLHSSRQLRFRCRAKCLLLGLESRFRGACCSLGLSQLRPSCFLTGGDFPSYRSAHSALVPCCDPRFSRRTE